MKENEIHQNKYDDNFDFSNYFFTKNKNKSIKVNKLHSLIIYKIIKQYNYSINTSKDTITSFFSIIIYNKFS